MKKKYYLSIFIIFLFVKTNLISQQTLTIDYYGVICDEIDENMSKMTSDLYYSQLCEINNFNILDKRTSSKQILPNLDSLSESNLSFYTTIKNKEGSSKWILTLTLIDKFSNKTNSQTKEYDSFYKILMEPKSELKTTIKELLNNTNLANDNNTTQKDIDNLFNSQEIKHISSTEFLSGTWEGEDNINKIVIMRGGRGFVIFKNGASMNVKVSLEGKDIKIIQNGKSNASFFPELPRDIALKIALNAQPIHWDFIMSDENTLIGNKSTIILDGQETKNTNINVIWKRKK